MEEPSDEREVMLSTSLIFERADSITSVTRESTSSGEAPE